MGVGEVAEVEGDAEGGVGGVEEGFGGETADGGAGEGVDAVRSCGAGIGGELIGAGIGEDAEERAELEAVADELASEGVEESGVGGGVGHAEVVDWVDEPAGEEGGPCTVDLDFGEERVVWGGEPVGEEMETVRGNGEWLAAEGGGEGRGVAARVAEVAFGVERDDLFAGEFHAVVVVAAAVAEDVVADAVEDGGEAVVVVLGPAVEGVVVAAGAADAGAEEELGGGFGAEGGVAEDAPVVGGGVLIGTAVGGEEGADEEIGGEVGVDGVAEPLVHGAGAGGVHDAFLEAEEVGPFERPPVGEGRGEEELVDEPGAFVRSGVGGEAFGGGAVRELAGEVEGGAAEERGVVAERSGCGFELAETVEDVLVDEVEFGRVWEGEVRIGREEGEGDRALEEFEADDDGGFAGLACGDDAVGGDGGDEVREFVDGGAGDVAGGTVGERGGDGERDRGVRGFDDAFGRGDGEICEGGGVWWVVGGAFADP